MRPGTLAVLCCIALAACSDGPPAGGNRAGIGKVRAEKSGPLVSRNPGAEAGGMALLLEGPNAMSRASAQAIAEIWAAHLDRSGFPSFEIVFLPPRRIQVSFWGVQDPVRARNALRAAYGNPLDLRLIEERTIP